MQRVWAVEVSDFRFCQCLKRHCNSSAHWLARKFLRFYLFLLRKRWSVLRKATAYELKCGGNEWRGYWWWEMRPIYERSVLACICWFSNRTISSVVSIFEIFAAPRNALHAISLQENTLVSACLSVLCEWVCSQPRISYADSFFRKRMGVLALGKLSISVAASTWIMTLFFIAFICVCVWNREKYLVILCLTWEWEDFQYAIEIV